MFLSRYGTRIDAQDLADSTEDGSMNNAVHQLIGVILHAMAWLLNAAAALWLWSWSQIASVFALSWGNLPPWKLAIGLVAVAVLAATLLVVALRAWDAFDRITRAFWTTMVTLLGLVSFVIMAGLFSRGFTWVVASVPDRFWQNLI